MTEHRDIKITGIGGVCALGRNTDEIWDGLSHGQRSTCTVNDPLFKAAVTEMYLADDGQVNDHSAADLGLQAAHEALAQARIGGFDDDRSALSLVLGTGMGESTAREARELSVPSFGDEASKVFSTAAVLASNLGATGPVVSTSNACAASAYALGYAADLIESGRSRAVLVVGAEAYSRVAMAAFNRMHALDGEGCRPFTEERRGTLFGEGAGAVLLEPADSPTTALAWLRGTAFSCDAGHLTAPDENAEQITRAFVEATPHDALITEVIPHGTGTVLNDAIESTMLSAQVPDANWLNLKAFVGHTGGASALLSLVVAVLSLSHEVTPPNPLVGKVIPAAKKALTLDSVPVNHNIAINAYAFGGNNATIVIGSAK